jgi:hypothetical protein
MRSDSATWLSSFYGTSYLTLTEPLVSGESDELGYSIQTNPIALTSLVISLTVNAIATGLIVLRILKVYWNSGRSTLDRTLGVGRDNPKLRSIIFIIIESGMAMFSIQLIRVVLSSIFTFNCVILLQIVIYINQMLNVIIQSVISTFSLY